MNIKEKKISIFSRVFLILSSLALAVSIFVPIWKIELDAPQYPEGLNLKIYADKIGGNVDIINGLNHYIGMKTLHTEDFFEFVILTYLIGFFALLSFFIAIVGRKKLLYLLFFSFVLFGIIALADFWRWEYNYGHNLDPNAAIIVPGMAYQPPLIGFKQLLNFGAYSIPDIGGWLMLAAGILILSASAIEFKSTYNRTKSIASKPASTAVISFFILLSSCSTSPQHINLNVDNCSYCEMTISDKRFATELVTTKGKIFKFDDLTCMLRYMKENKSQAYNGIYISNYLTPNELLNVEKTFIIMGENIGSPMQGNMAAFNNKDSAISNAHRLNATLTDWSVLKP